MCLYEEVKSYWDTDLSAAKLSPHCMCPKGLGGTPVPQAGSSYRNNGVHYRTSKYAEILACSFIVGSSYICSMILLWVTKLVPFFKCCSTLIQLSRILSILLKGTFCMLWSEYWSFLSLIYMFGYACSTVFFTCGISLASFLHVVFPWIFFW